VSSICCLSNPMIIVPSMSVTGTPLCCVFSNISVAACWSVDTSFSVYFICCSSRNFFSILHHGHVGVLYTVMFFAIKSFFGFVVY